MAMIAKDKCRVCGGKCKPHKKTCGKQKCIKRAPLTINMTGPWALDEVSDFKKELVKCKEAAVELAREENITIMYCKELHILWIDEGVELDLTHWKQLGYPSIYRGIRGEVDKPYTAHKGITENHTVQ